MITPEFIKQCLAVMDEMEPEDFIRMVHHDGRMDGKLEELKDRVESIKRIIQPPSEPTGYKSAHSLIEFGLDRWLEHRGGCDRDDA